ncbi:myristoylated alanine-rich C-kinase substrate-like [Ammospiza nelsoni]|uniref:myristoylated alanine-rich C-kinase substrate-like n=1 Tax=Ammospiza nelsoni TaxID=2857394 RepID=UPI002869B328|nr:myristoylated alanine-rich C-kinase substrate-like [Ammospiza nelsoni]
MRCNFPSPFQQSLVNTVCGEARASPALPQSRAGAGEPGRGAGAGHRTPCRGRQKQTPPDGAVALAAAAALPGPQTLLPAGWELLPRVPFVARQAAAPAARGAHGQPHAAASAEDFAAAAADRRGLRGTTAQAAETPRRAGCGGTEVTWQKGGRPAQVPPRNRCGRRAAGAQPRPGPSAPRSAQSQPARSAAHARWAAAGAVPAGPEAGCGWSASGSGRAGRRPACRQGTPHTERGKEMATGTERGVCKISGRCVRSSSCFKNPPCVYLIAMHRADSRGWPSRAQSWMGNCCGLGRSHTPCLALPSPSPGTSALERLLPAVLRESARWLRGCAPPGQRGRI